MKIRNGFVSNSSSSSFVVMLPKNFDPKLFVDNMTDEEIDNAFQWDNYTREEIFNAISRLYTDKCLYQYDDSKEMNICSELLDEFIITSTEGGPDDGTISLVSDEEREKIKNLLTLELRYDKIKHLNQITDEN
jgi:hypothetical protein